MRAVVELRATRGRTWFGTLTLAPQSHFEVVSRIRLRLAKRGEDFDTFPETRQFSERVHEIGKEITLWLKRVRKESAAKLRYVLVAERHKSGLPHFHLLVHEVCEDRPVAERTLRKQWHLGFSQFKLVAQGDETRTAGYVAKYLTKSALARVRSSVGYGLGSEV